MDYHAVKVGVMGYPHEATAELGKTVTDEVVAGAVKMLASLDRQTRAKGKRRARGPERKMRLLES